MATRNVSMDLRNVICQPAADGKVQRTAVHCIDPETHPETRKLLEQLSAMGHKEAEDAAQYALRTSQRKSDPFIVKKIKENIIFAKHKETYKLLTHLEDTENDNASDALSYAIRASQRRDDKFVIGKVKEMCPETGEPKDKDVEVGGEGEDKGASFEMHGTLYTQWSSATGPASDQPLFAELKPKLVLDDEGKKPNGETKGHFLEGVAKLIMLGDSGAQYRSETPWFASDSSNNKLKVMLLSAYLGGSHDIGIFSGKWGAGLIDLRNRTSSLATDRDYQGYHGDLINPASRALGGFLDGAFALGDGWNFGARFQTGHPINDLLNAPDYQMIGKDQEGMWATGGKLYLEYERPKADDKKSDGKKTNKSKAEKEKKEEVGVEKARIETGVVGGHGGGVDGKYNAHILGGIVFSLPDGFSIGTEDYFQQTELGSRVGANLLLGWAIKKFSGITEKDEFKIKLLIGGAYGSMSGFMDDSLQVVGRRGRLGAPKELDGSKWGWDILIKPEYILKFAEECKFIISPWIIFGQGPDGYVGGGINAMFKF